MPSADPTNPTEPSWPQDPAAKMASSRLLESRTILLFGEIDMRRAEQTCAQLWALSQDAEKPITLLLHSPGGHVESADTIFDMIRYVTAPVFILGSGWVASAGALIYCAAQKARRFALPNTRFMLHQPLGGVGGPATDVEIEAEQIAKMRKRLNRIFAEATGQSEERIHRDSDRNFWLGASEAVDYGLVQEVLSSQKDFARRLGAG